MNGLIFEALKRTLKAKGVTYRDLAERTNHYRRGWMMQAPFIEYGETGLLAGEPRSSSLAS